jgi:hypothetical protein
MSCWLLEFVGFLLTGGTSHQLLSSSRQQHRLRWTCCAVLCAGSGLQELGISSSSSSQLHIRQDQCRIPAVAGSRHGQKFDAISAAVDIAGSD